MDVYDEKVMVSICRNGTPRTVPFSELHKDDVVVNKNTSFTCGSDAHESGDADYEGWLVYDTDGNGYYPEDFGASKKS